MFKSNMSFKYTNNIKRFDRQYRTAQKRLDSEVLKDTAPFIPMQDGYLMRSGITNTIIGSGEIKYKTPYARRLYYGRSFNFSKKKHPRATAFWFEKSKSVNKSKWLKIVRRLAGGK